MPCSPRRAAATSSRCTSATPPSPPPPRGLAPSSPPRPVEVPFTAPLYADPALHRLDAGALFEAALTPRTKAVYLISPNNPDGKVLTRAQLESVARFAVEHDLWVIS